MDNDYQRLKLYNVWSRIITLRKTEKIFGTNNFSTAFSSDLKYMILEDSNPDGGISKVLVIGNFGPGAGEGSRLAVGATILGGMIISTFFTLYITPAMYLALAKNTKRIDAVDLELKKELIRK